MSACPLVDLLDWSQLIQRWTLGGLQGLSNISIKSKCILQQAGTEAHMNCVIHCTMSLMNTLHESNERPEDDNGHYQGNLCNY